MKLQEWRPVQFAPAGQHFSTKEEAAQYAYDLVMRSALTELYGVYIADSDESVVCMTLNGPHSAANGLVISNLPACYESLLYIRGLLQTAIPLSDESELMAMILGLESKDTLLATIEELLAVAKDSSLLEPLDSPDANG